MLTAWWGFCKLTSIKYRRDRLKCVGMWVWGNSHSDISYAKMWNDVMLVCKTLPGLINLYEIYLTSSNP